MTTETDPRKEGLKEGLRQLTGDQIRRVLNYKGEILTDHWNYKDGCWCPLAIGLGLDQLWGTERPPTHESVYMVLTLMGYRVNNTRGLEGEFYRENRLADLRVAATEVLAERGETPLKAILLGDDGKEFIVDELAIQELLEESILFMGWGNHGGHCRLYVNCSDLFAWACAEGEPLPPNEVENLYRAHHTGKYGVDKWCCKQRGEKPQPVIEERIRKAGEWDEEMENLKPNYYGELCKKTATLTEQTPNT